MIIPQITGKQKAILQLIYRFRFLNRAQIQTLMRHKDYRRINAWLKDLYDKEYVGRIYVKRIVQNTKPAIYFLNRNGLRYLRKNSEDLKIEPSTLKKFYKEKERTRLFANHCILAAEVYVSLIRGAKEAEAEVVNYLTREEMRGDEDVLSELNPKPDLYFYLKDGKVKKTYFVEVQDYGSPKYAQKMRIKGYFDYYSDWDHDWPKKVKLPYPVLLLITPSPGTQNYTHYMIKKLANEWSYPSDLTIFTTTYGRLKKEGFFSEIWEKFREEDDDEDYEDEVEESEE